MSAPTSPDEQSESTGGGDPAGSARGAGVLPRGINALLERARTVEVRPQHAAQRVAELDRWTRRSAPRRWPAFALGFAVAAAVALAIAWRWPRTEIGMSAALVPAAVEDRDSPVGIGERVAVIAAVGTVYRVAVGSADETEIVVERGAVTARLWPGARPHRLALRGAGVSATAAGTVFALAVDARGAQVSVYEGVVEVVEGAGRHRVAAGSGWPAVGSASAALETAGAARRLLALAELPAAAVPAPDAEIRNTSHPPEPPTDAGVRIGKTATPRPPDAGAPDAPPPPTLTERWRAVRLLRGQNKLAEAIAECEAMAGARDATWSPIALVEAMRIEIGPRASPERAIALADRMAREWPAHALAVEARELRCRALRQLGRASECAPAPPP